MGLDEGRVIRCPAREVESQVPIEVFLFHEGQDQRTPPPARQAVTAQVGIADAIRDAGLGTGSLNVGRREAEIGVRIVMEGQANLLEVVETLQPPRGFASRLHGRQQQRNQDPDDRHDHQKFDHRESAASTG